MASSHLLKVGFIAEADVVQGLWLRHNLVVNKGIQKVQNITGKDGKPYRYHSVCHMAPVKGWSKAAGCRAHLKYVGSTKDKCEITSVDLEHTCCMSDNKRKRNYGTKDLAKMSEAIALCEPTTSRKGNANQFINLTKAATGLPMKKGQAYKAVHKASNDTLEAQLGQYMLLPSLFTWLEANDPRGTHEIDDINSSWHDEVVQFGRCYVCLSASKDFFSEAKIQFISMDGTFTKLGDFRQIMLVAVTFDANNQIIPLSIAIVGGENEDNWVWFQQHLQNDFPSFNLLMCDADKGVTSHGFAQSLSQHTQDACTSRCARHLAANMGEAFPHKVNEEHKLMVQALGHSRTREVYEERLDRLRHVHIEWGEWLDERKEQFVAYAFLERDIRRWGKVTSNSVENINSAFLGLRELPILFMILGAIEYIQKRLLEGRSKAEEMSRKGLEVTQYARSEQMATLSVATTRHVVVTDQTEPLITGKVATGVHSNYCGYIEVKANVKTGWCYCACQYHEEYGFLCEHLQALLHHLSYDTLDRKWFDERHWISTYKKAYSCVIPTLAPAGKLTADLWCAPPDFRKSAGRPKKKRKDRSHRNLTQNQRVCRACGGLGHMMGSCEQPSTEYRFIENQEAAWKWACDCVMVSSFHRD